MGDTTGIRKCNSRVMKTPRRKKVAVAGRKIPSKKVRDARLMPCGQKAVISYDVKYTLGRRVVHFCEEHDPKTNIVGDIVEALNSQHWRVVEHVCRLESVTSISEQQSNRFVDSLIIMMDHKSKSRMSLDDWHRAVDTAWRIAAAKSVVDG
jgi:hypothetical protein